MIFVTVGTTHFPFDRLIAAVAGFELDEELVVQRGASKVVLGGATVVDFMSFAELSDHVRRARIVVSHAGVGSIMVALAQGQRPIVVPRLARYREAVDDHQVQVAAMLGERGRVVVVGDPAGLGVAIAAADDSSTHAGLAFGPLVETVADEVRRAIGTP